jgi:1-deoxy-D-xylulose-5-phosphate reductoisomerase
MSKKNIVILGSSGSIGESALAVVRQFKDKFRVTGLSVNANIDKLKRQIDEFEPAAVAVADPAQAQILAGQVRGRTKIFQGRDGICALASLKEADLVLVAIVGAEAVYPLLSAIRAKKTIALANKESVVVAGAIVRQEAKKRGVRIIPIDSEQSAIFQCLAGYDPKTVERIYLTASGGPLWGLAARRLKEVSLKAVLAHPKWKMGKKITVDSATLMNKGLEVIEAQQLFDMDLRKIKVLVHRQALVHSMVEFVDGSILAQIGATDMRLPIQLALSWPQKWPNPRLKIDPLAMGALTFSKPDTNKFPCLELAYEAARQGGTAPCVLNAANEVAVNAFLGKKLSFTDIPKVIERVMAQKGMIEKKASLEGIFAADRAARRCASQWIDGF